MALQLESPDFSKGQSIPRVFTCEGKDVSPALKWKGAPQGTVTFALICDDPDAPMGTWVHWVVYNIAADVNELPQGLGVSEVLGADIQQGMTDFGRTGYGGPCPPPGRPHRYFFKLYALDAKLDIKGKVRKESLLIAMEGHILAETSLMGTYKR